MPTVITIGGAAARGFGLTAGVKEPPGSITYNNGYSGASYKPKGYSTVTVVCYGSYGTNSGYGGSPYEDAGKGSVATNTAVPVATLMIYCPSGVRVSQWPGGGSGGTGATVSQTNWNGHAGGAVCAATWTGGVLVAAGGGGSSSYSTSRVSRYGGYEGSGTALGNNTYPPSTNNGVSSPNVGSCYYGGGGGGGGYSLGGGAGSTNNGGRAGGNGATPSPTGTGSYGYTSLSTTNQQAGYAVVSWG